MGSCFQKLQRNQQEALLVRLTETRLHVVQENLELEKQINRLTEEILYRNSLAEESNGDSVFSEFPTSVNPRFGSSTGRFGERESTNSRRLSDGLVYSHQRSGVSSTDLVME